MTDPQRRLVPNSEVASVLSLSKVFRSVDREALAVTWLVPAVISALNTFLVGRAVQHMAAWFPVTRCHCWAHKSLFTAFCYFSVLHSLILLAFRAALTSKQDPNFNTPLIGS